MWLMTITKHSTGELLATERSDDRERLDRLATVLLGVDDLLVVIEKES